MKQTVIYPEPFYAAFSANLILACACLRLAIVRMALGVKLLAMSAVNFMHVCDYASVNSSGAHPPPRTTAGHLLTLSVPGVGYSQFYRIPGAGH